MSDAERILDLAKEMTEEFLNVLHEAVELESPSLENKEASDKCCAFFQKLFRDGGFQVEVLPQTMVGDHILAEYGQGEERLMMVGHYDTVFPIGTIQKAPWKIENKEAYGLGAMDMKGGLLEGYFAVRILKELNLLPQKKIVFFINADEESGSYYSSKLIVEQAKKCKSVMVLEPGRGRLGEIKTARYGRGVYKIIAHGKSTHSGNSPREAISPIMELLHQIEIVTKWNDFDKGITVTPTCIFSGVEGTAMTPDDGWFSIDVRTSTAAYSKELDEKIFGLEPYIDGIRLEIQGGIEKPPFDFNEGNQALFHHADILARELGFSLEGATMGGGSDGNFTSDAGIPTIDGMGMTGAGIHNVSEHIHIDDIPYHIALLARMLQTL